MPPFCTYLWQIWKVNCQNQVRRIGTCLLKAKAFFWKSSAFKSLRNFTKWHPLCERNIEYRFKKLKKIITNLRWKSSYFSCKIQDKLILLFVNRICFTEGKKIECNNTTGILWAGFTTAKIGTQMRESVRKKPWAKLLQKQREKLPSTSSVSKSSHVLSVIFWVPSKGIKSHWNKRNCMYQHRMSQRLKHRN
jgi:hypothetical protein